MVEPTFYPFQKYEKSQIGFIFPRDRGENKNLNETTTQIFFEAHPPRFSAGWDSHPSQDAGESPARLGWWHCHHASSLCENGFQEMKTFIGEK